MMLRVLMLSVISLSLSACSMVPKWGDDDGHLIHVVLIWLKEQGNTAHRQQIIQSSRVLGEIPGVREVRAGSVVSSDREVVRDDYDVGLMVRFDNVEDLQTYLEHPLHVNTVRTRMAPLMQRYEVIDFVSP